MTMYEALSPYFEQGSGGESVPGAGPARPSCVRRESGAQFVRRPSSAIAQFACRPLQLLTHSTANALTCRRPAPRTTPLPYSSLQINSHSSTDETRNSTCIHSIRPQKHPLTDYKPIYIIKTLSQHSKSNPIRDSIAQNGHRAICPPSHSITST